MTGMLARALEFVRKVGRGYGGLWLMFEVGILLSGLVIWALLSGNRGLPRGLLVNELFLNYCWVYWDERLLWIVGSALVVVVFMAFQADRALYNRFFSPTAYWRLDARTRRGRQAILVLLLLPTGFVVLALPPLLHLYYPAWVIAAAGLLPLPVATAEYLVLFWGERRELRMIRGLAHHRVLVKTFNTGALGVRSARASRETEVYARSTQKGPMSEETLSYIERGSESVEWKGNDAFIRLAGEMLQVPGDTIELFDRTTDAIRHALSEVLRTRTGSAVMVVSSDNEYDSIKSLLHELEASGEVRLVAVPIRELIWSGGSVRDVTRKIVETIPRETEVVVLSHVTYDTGFVVDIWGLQDAVDTRRGDEQMVWIVDGAQAVGNIPVVEMVMERSDYYATSGHKWLGGKPSLGLLYRNPRRRAEGRLPSTRSLSRIGDTTPSGTINIEPHVSLNAMLKEFQRIGLPQVAKHNLDLAKRLSDFFQREGGLSSVPSVPQCGIVCIRGNAGLLERLYLRLRAIGVESTLIAERDGAMTSGSIFPLRGGEATRGSGGGYPVAGLRFCCHYYHSEVDVYELVGRVVALLSVCR